MAESPGVEEVARSMADIAVSRKQMVPAAPHFPTERVIQDLAMINKIKITTADIQILQFKQLKPRARKVVAEMYLQEKAWKNEIKLPTSITQRRDLRLNIMNKLLRLHGTALFIAAVKVPKPKARELMNNYLMVNKNLLPQPRAKKSMVVSGRNKLEDLSGQTSKVPIGFIEVTPVTPTIKRINLKKEMENNITRLYAQPNIISPLSSMNIDEILFSLVSHVYKQVVQHVKAEKITDSQKNKLLTLIEDPERRQVFSERYSFGAFIYCICHTQKLADFLTDRFEPRFHYLNKEKFLAGKLHEFEALWGFNGITGIREALEITSPYKYVVFMHVGSSPDFAANPFHADLLNGAS